MLPDQLFLFTTLGLLIINFTLLVYTFTVYKRNKQSEEVIYKSGNNLLLEAQNKAKLIVESAAFKAKQILVDAEYLKEGMDSKLEQALEQAAQNEIMLLQKKGEEINSWYSKMFEQIRNQQSQKASQTVQQMGQVATNEMEGFKQTLEREAVTVEETVSKQATEYYQKAQKEIDAYKLQEFEKIKSSANQITLQVVGEVLGKELNSQDHQKLIIEALEKAKQEDAFASFQPKKNQ